MADGLEELEARVAKMRALGVLEWGDIRLGPPPPPPPEPAAEPPTREQGTRSYLDRILRSSGVAASESFVKRWLAATERVEE